MKRSLLAALLATLIFHLLTPIIASALGQRADGTHQAIASGVFFVIFSALMLTVGRARRD